MKIKPRPPGATFGYPVGYVTYTMMRAYYRGFVTLDELLDEADRTLQIMRAIEIKNLLQKMKPLGDISR